MLFNSLIFLFLFLPITYLVFWQLKGKNQRYLWLNITGYVFYGFWNWKFCFLMLFSTCVSYLTGLGFLKYDRDPKMRRWLLVFPITIDLLLLGYFKYSNFFLDAGASLFSALLGKDLHPGHLNIVLPIGISFYTFHTISYIVDSYRRVIRPTRNFLEFSCYVSLFSQLVAGPIVRFKEVERDLDNIEAAERWKNLEVGISFFLVGLAKKVILADSIAAVIDPALAKPLHLSSISAWLCMLGYTYQLYFDFSGYSDMAVGLGRMFGIKIPQNFNSPYKALDPSDFWRRWHISLSTCMRDYLYIPFGGNRGTKWLVRRNLLLTMLIGGLWHGANWTFLFWGAYHGLLLVIYQTYASVYDSLPRSARKLIMFIAVLIGWVPFRMANMGETWLVWERMFSFKQGSQQLVGQGALILLLFAAGVIAHLAPNSFELRHRWSARQAVAWGFCFVICLILIAGGESSPFLYFQF